MEFPCIPNPECPYNKKGGCREDEHHLYWPGNEYRGTVEKTFRNLPENKIQMCRRLHDVEHSLQPPTKPDKDKMLETIIDADTAGRICLSATKRRAVYGN